jgi:peptide/nickel transport system permease protein
MPEPPADTVAERDVKGGAADLLPVDAGIETQIAAIETDDAGVVKKKLGIGAWIALAWIVIVLGCCALAPFLPVPGATERVDGLSRVAPFEDGSHLLGGDAIGRDMLSRLIYGARNSLFIGVGSITMGILVGGFLGLVAGYYRGRLESVIVGTLDVMLSIPALILALTLTIFLEPRVQDLVKSKETTGRLTLTFALGIIAIPTLARITRANSLVWAQREFVTAARAQGARNFRIMFREVLPNVVPAMAAIALLSIAVVIIAEASLSILGAGIDLPAPTWGNIIQEGFPDFTNEEAPHIVFEASLVIFLTVLALNFLGDAVRARFDVREARI